MRGETLLQPRPNAFFSANYVFPSSKSSEDQKKSSPKIEEFLSPKSSENQKKKSLPQFGTKFSRNLLDLFGLTGPFSSDQPALKSRWGDAAESRWGDAKFRWEDANYRWGCASPRPPYNLKTALDSKANWSALNFVAGDSGRSRQPPGAFRLSPQRPLTKY